MIDHIDKVTQNVEKIIIVFTGDMVEKGEFEKAKQAVYNFFTDLKIKLGNIYKEKIKICRKLK